MFLTPLSVIHRKTQYVLTSRRVNHRIWRYVLPRKGVIPVMTRYVLSVDTLCLETLGPRD